LVDYFSYFLGAVMKLSEMVKGKVTFKYFRDGALWYTCENGFMFPVEIGEDTKGATFMNEDKGLYFMRWIRKYAGEIGLELS